VSDLPPAGQPRRFTSAELDGAPGVAPDELAADTMIARRLEDLAEATRVSPTPSLADRVMGAIASEPVPAPVRVAGLAVRRRSLGAFLLSLRDAWRVMTSAGFPMAARAQAMALVLLVAAVATGSSMATAGALGLFDGGRETPSPSIEQPSQSTEPSTRPSEATESSTDGSMSPEASPSEEASESPDDESAEPDASTEPSESPDNGGSGGATATPRPTATPAPTPTASDHEDHTATPSPSDTPKPTDTPKPED